MSKKHLHKNTEEYNEEFCEENYTECENTEKIALNPEDCKALVCPDCTIFKEAEDTRIRALAEMENFKKRLQKEKDEQMAYAAESVLADLLPTLDNLDLALQYGSKNEACKDTIMGVEMTKKLLLDAVKKHGLEPVGTVGKRLILNFMKPSPKQNMLKFPKGTLSPLCKKAMFSKEDSSVPQKLPFAKRKTLPTLIRLFKEIPCLHFTA